MTDDAFDKLLTIEEAGHFLRLKDLGFANPTRTIKRWCAKGLLSHGSIGRKPVFTRSQLQEFALRHEKGRALVARAEPPGRRNALPAPRGNGRKERSAGIFPPPIKLAPGKLPDWCRPSPPSRRLFPPPPARPAS